MRKRQADDDRAQTTTGRRPFLLSAGAAVGTVALAGCAGDDSGGSVGRVADVDPLGSAVTSSGVPWDDLGDLEGEMTIYSGRTIDQIDPVFDALEDRYPDLTINRDYDDNDAQVNKLIQEGEATPADVFYSQDPGALNAVANEGLTQALPGDVVDTVPASRRHPDGQWTGVSGRVRSIQYNPERLAEETPFDGPEDLPTDIFAYAEDDAFEGIISTRPNSGTFRGFIQAMVQLHGETETRQWVRDFMDQDPTLYTSGSTQPAEIERGGDDDPILGLGNTYYAARILNENPDASINVTFTNGDAGALFSVAGIAATDTADDPELVAEFARHMVAIDGQEFFQDVNGEFPVIDGVDYVGPLPNPAELNSPEFDLSSFDMDLEGAIDILEDEGMLPVQN
ncbi:MAG: extracellular solute-binding protein [Natronomonas sp.]